MKTSQLTPSRKTRHDLGVLSHRTSPKFPQTDCHFQADASAEFGRCHAANAPSFRSISESYFQKEAHRSFAAEAAFFAVIIITSAISVLKGAGVLVDLLRSMGGV